MAAWATTDPATLLFTSCVLRGRPEDVGLEAHLFELEFSRDDVNTFIELARRPTLVDTLLTATGGQPHQSRRYRELLAPLGVVDELRAAFVENGHCWGTLVAYRVAGSAFAPDDVALLAAVAPAIAAGLRTAMLHTALHNPPTIGPPARRRLDRPRRHGAGRQPASTALARPDRRNRPAPQRAAIGSRCDPGRGRRPWTHHRGPRAGAATQPRRRLDPPARHPAGSQQTGRGRRRTRHRNPPSRRPRARLRREREITELVVRGYSTTDIATALFISAYTVQDHLKSILAKTGVANRRELVAALHGRHYSPATRAGHPPSPTAGNSPTDHTAGWTSETIMVAMHTRPVAS